MKEDKLDNLIAEFFALAIKDILRPNTRKKHRLSAIVLIEDFEDILNDFGVSKSFTQSVIKKGRAYYASNTANNNGTKQTHNINRILS
jgi:hypothetical protein